MSCNCPYSVYNYDNDNVDKDDNDDDDNVDKDDNDDNDKDDTDDNDDNDKDDNDIRPVNTCPNVKSFNKIDAS